jgi:phospholipase C
MSTTPESVSTPAAAIGSDEPVGLQAGAFPGVYLRMDGRGVTPGVATGPGGGVVNCQGSAGAWELFTLAPQVGNQIAIESVAFPGVFLRMDGRGVPVGDPEGPDGGVVNCQGTVGPWELFTLQGNNPVGIESVAFPGVYLRMDGTGVTPGTPTGPGGGNVDCQGYLGTLEWIDVVAWGTS